MTDQKKTAGWYMGLHYMRNNGLRPDGPMIDRPDASADFVFVDDIVCLVPDWQLSLAQWWDKVKVGGVLVIAVPHCRHKDAPRKFETADFLKFFKDQPCLVHEDDVLDGDIFIVLRKTDVAGMIYRPWRKKAKHCVVMRFGAFGDALMAASVLPGLKAEGWSISFNCLVRGEETLQHDPHIDEFFTIQDSSIPESEVAKYWEALEKRFDRAINLTHSVEGHLLKQPWRGDYYWSEAARRNLCQGSYLAQTHQIADVPGPYRVKFYPTPDEVAWSAKKAKDLGPFVLWCLNGSAVHKWYPYVSKVVTRLLHKTDLRFVLSGGEQSKEQEQAILDAAIDYHGDSSRVFSLVCTGSIRRVMALAQRAAVVVGPETGVLNAICMDDVPKVCLLSHSAESNLTDDWVNTIAIKPKVHCHPCHRLHNSHQYCPQDPVSKAAICAAAVNPSEFEQAILEAVRSGAKAMTVPQNKMMDFSAFENKGMQ